MTVPPPPQFQEMTGSDEWKTATPSDEVMKGKWWEMFNDPLLNQLEEKVAIDNFNVKVIEAQFRQARAIVLASTANLDPQISTQPSINQTIRGSNSGRLGFGSSFGLPFLANWEPDLWGRLHTIIEGNTATAQFRQVYVSDRLKANSMKTLVLTKHGGKWLIKQERAGS